MLQLSNRSVEPVSGTEPLPVAVFVTNDNWKANFSPVPFMLKVAGVGSYPVAKSVPVPVKDIISA